MPSKPVQVAFRVRPLLQEEKEEERYGCIHVNDERSRVAVRTKDNTHHFNFDKVFPDNSSQTRLFEKCVAPLVPDFLSGRNCCVIALGDKGSGKTYTMMGPEENETENDVYDDQSGVSSMGSGGVSRQHIADIGSESDMSFRPPQQIIANSPNHSEVHHAMREIDEFSGAVPRTAKEIYSLFKKRRKKGGSPKDDPTLQVSFVEIHKEKIIDLLDKKRQEQTLSVRSSSEKGVYIENATLVKCKQESEVLTVFETGQTARRERAARLGTDTSRSHAIVILKIERYSKSRGKKATSNLFLVDSADVGLVRKNPSKDEQDFYLEAKSAKRSFSALRKCLRALALGERSKPPYGESVLTKVLHDTLTKGSAVCMVVTACPMSAHVSETLSAIRYANYISGQKEHSPEPSEAGSSKRTERRKDEQSRSGKSGSETRSALSKKSMQKSYEELETVDNMLKRLPESADGPSDGNPVEELANAANLLESVAKRMEADLTVAEKELHASGVAKVLNEAEMEQQLKELSLDLENMKIDGNLTLQIQNDLAEAQAQLARLNGSDVKETLSKAHSGSRKASAANSTSHSGRSRDRGNSKHQRNAEAENDKAEQEIARLKKQVEELQKSNNELQRQKENSTREMSLARRKIEDLQKNQDHNDPSATQRTSETSTETELDGSGAVNDSIGINYQVHVVQDEEDDPWDELNDNTVEVGTSQIQVCLRLRPMTKLERNRRSKNCIEVHEDHREFTVDSPIDGEYDFCFDHVFDVGVTQAEIYENVGISIADNLMAGVNCAVMAYGLTGTGKSHTLAGKLPELKDDDSSSESSDDNSASTEHTPSEEDAGFSPRLIADLFRRMKEAPSSVQFKITCSYVCIYLEKMFDLLDPRFDKNLVVRDSSNGMKIEGAVEAYCFNDEDIIHIIRRGAACRRLIGSKLNIQQSRSHSILTLSIEQHHAQSGSIRRAYLQLAELAGFEVTSKAKGQSVQETKIIHKSFSALGNVIKSLTEGNSHAPYRESKLTSILKDALGGNCKTTFFITASPSSYNISETINSIRLGQRVRRVANKPRINIDCGMEEYRRWLLQSEMKLGEMSKYVKEFSTDLLEAGKKDAKVADRFSDHIWETVMAIAEEEESMTNPCRKALLIEEETDPNLVTKAPWRALMVELAKRLPSDKTIQVMRARDRAESLLTDIQSESVVLRRQNELLVQEKRKKDDELGRAHRENKRISLQNQELEHKLAVAETRAKEAVTFLRYTRTLCWKLQKDSEKDRPLEVGEITSSLQGTPDLSGLVDLDEMMIDVGLLLTKDMNVESVETEYFNFLQEAGLIIDEEQAAAEEEIDELAGLDDSPENNRWNKAKATNLTRSRSIDRSHLGHNGTVSSDDHSKGTSTTDPASYLGSVLGWGDRNHNKKNHHQQPQQASKSGARIVSYGQRNTRRERELQRDLQNMANKCVDLQMEINDHHQLLENITGKTNSLKMKGLTREVLSLTKERDRMMHNAKAATWKLQELHVVNKLLSKQNKETQRQVHFLEEGFSRLQESFRTTVQDGLDADHNLRERIKTLQGIVDSLTGPPPDDNDDDDRDGGHNDNSTTSSDDTNPLNARLHLPVRGKKKNPRTMTMVSKSAMAFVDPKHQGQSLWLFYKGKKRAKLPRTTCHFVAKHVRKSRKTGTALIGKHRKALHQLYEQGKKLILPLFLDEDEDSCYSSSAEEEQRGGSNHQHSNNHHGNDDYDDDDYDDDDDDDGEFMSWKSSRRN